MAHGTWAQALHTVRSGGRGRLMEAQGGGGGGAFGNVNENVPPPPFSLYKAVRKPKGQFRYNSEICTPPANKKKIQSLFMLIKLTKTRIKSNKNLRNIE